jgi:hypothetical protein
MIDLYDWPTSNGHKVAIFLEETGLEYRIAPYQYAQGRAVRARASARCSPSPATSCERLLKEFRTRSIATPTNRAASFAAQGMIFSALPCLASHVTHNPWTSFITFHAL